MSRDLEFPLRPRSSVLQDWVAELTFMQQSVLLTGVRGPDGLPKYHAVKYLLRWYRRCVLRSSFLGITLTNPVEGDGGSFLGASIEPRCAVCANQQNLHETSIYLDDDLEEHEFVMDLTPSGWAEPMSARVTAYIATLDEVPHHFQLHLLHCAEILGYKHPDSVIRSWWRGVYERLVHDMHLWPESEVQMDARLGDTREGWLARGDEATNA